MTTAPIDLRRAGPGWTVHFRCGGTAVVQEVVTRTPARLTFVGFSHGAAFGYADDGIQFYAVYPNPLDIVAIEPPPRTEAQMREALAEIAKEGSEMARLIPAQSPIPPETGIKLLAQAMKILALAEGKP
jgi:hypothetical protein